MEYGCPRCNMERSITSMLEEIPEQGIFICNENPEHRYKLGEDGFLISTK